MGNVAWCQYRCEAGETMNSDGRTLNMTVRGERHEYSEYIYIL